jgi:hypothetical protein
MMVDSLYWQSETNDHRHHSLTKRKPFYRFRNTQDTHVSIHFCYSKCVLEVVSVDPGFKACFCRSVETCVCCSLVGRLAVLQPRICAVLSYFNLRYVIESSCLRLAGWPRYFLCCGSEERLRRRSPASFAWDRHCGIRQK